MERGFFFFGSPKQDKVNGVDNDRDLQAQLALIMRELEQLDGRHGHEEIPAWYGDHRLPLPPRPPSQHGDLGNLLGLVPSYQDFPSEEEEDETMLRWRERGEAPFSFRLPYHPHVAPPQFRVLPYAHPDGGNNDGHQEDWIGYNDDNGGLGSEGGGSPAMDNVPRFPPSIFFSSPLQPGTSVSRSTVCG